MKGTWKITKENYSYVNWFTRFTHVVPRFHTVGAEIFGRGCPIVYHSSGLCVQVGVGWGGGVWGYIGRGLESWSWGRLAQLSGCGFLLNISLFFPHPPDTLINFINVHRVMITLLIMNGFSVAHFVFRVLFFHHDSFHISDSSLMIPVSYIIVAC